MMLTAYWLILYTVTMFAHTVHSFRRCARFSLSLGLVLLVVFSALSVSIDCSTNVSSNISVSVSSSPVSSTEDQQSCSDDHCSGDDSSGDDSSGDHSSVADNDHDESDSSCESLCDCICHGYMALSVVGEVLFPCASIKDSLVLSVLRKPAGVINEIHSPPDII